MNPPKVNPVGVVEYPQDFAGEVRVYGRATRLVALAFLVFFAAVTVASTVLSLGAYCLTSDGGDTRALRSSPLVASPPSPADSGQGSRGSAQERGDSSIESSAAVGAVR